VTEEAERTLHLFSEVFELKPTSGLGLESERIRGSRRTPNTERRTLNRENRARSLIQCSMLGVRRWAFFCWFPCTKVREVHGTDAAIEKEPEGILLSGPYRDVVEWELHKRIMQC
jgi:hypothetical protein